MDIYKGKGKAADFFYIRFRNADGKLVRRSSGTNDRSEAQAMLAEVEAEVARRKRAKLEQAVTGEKPMAKPRRLNWRRWTVDVVRWNRDIPQSRYRRLLARKTERPEGPALGEIIETAQVSDLQAAVAAGHWLLGRFAHEVRGAVSLEIHISGPEQAIEDERETRLRSIKVTPEAIEQAKALGMRGDVESQLRSMALNSQPHSHPHANRRYENFALRIEGAEVVWIGLVEPPPRPRKTK